MGTAKNKNIHDLSWVEEFPARELDSERFAGKTFKEIVKSYAERFMRPNQIADALMIAPVDFDKRCIAAFGMKASDVCKFYMANSDADVRDVLWQLTMTGNTTATKIYSEYISGIAKAEQDASNGIKVMVKIGVDDDEED